VGRKKKVEKRIPGQKTKGKTNYKMDSLPKRVYIQTVARYTPSSTVSPRTTGDDWTQLVPHWNLNELRGDVSPVGEYVLVRTGTTKTPLGDLEEEK